MQTWLVDLFLRAGINYTFLCAITRKTTQENDLVFGRQKIAKDMQLGLKFAQISSSYPENDPNYWRSRYMGSTVILIKPPHLSNILERPWYRLATVL